MKFHRSNSPEPEINLIPFIDVLLVVLIFLMLSTTYSKFTEMQLNLPVADAALQKDRPSEILVSVSSDGRYSVNRTLIPGRDVQSLSQALTQATQGLESPMVVISADAQASHQSVMLVMEAARRNGLSQLTFAAQLAGKSD
ncbi:biopolymer transporter ExbD [Limnohabitans sp. JirII-29]|uniref:ExbD/TolR family protein n=1 Tax=unclassified Limnohabitans TaxID=2626134 RepID=UPI000C1E63D4|nr:MULTISPECIES: biopolymer transporter ExbD [unclassified Limnohabitans]PIT80887.1 biopolymer transporter ExbD [Limnohabitans sp. JirII-31]PUE28233.1 biopolymer transporter ExbD [Limnohabitans sp. JirII-29]